MDNRRLEQIGAWGGIAFVVLQLVAQALVQAGGAEPSFDASAPEIVEFFMDRDARLYGLGDYFSTLSVIPFVWFMGSLWARLRRAEGEPGWLSLTAFGLGVLTMAQIIVGGGWTLAMARIDEGLDPELARLLFDQGNLGFANIWITLGGMLLAVGALSITTTALPNWSGWAALIIAIGMLVARALWTASGIVFIPYGLFWVWLVAVSIVMLRSTPTRSMA